MPSFRPLSVWFIGLPCSGKSTISQGVYQAILKAGFRTKIIDGDDLRKGINGNLGFSLSDRYENVRRAAEINKLFLEENYVILNALICPLQDMRNMAADIVSKKNFIEIFVDAPLSVCEERDVKGMYKKARIGEIINFTGISSPFEPPVKPDIEVKTHQMSIVDSVEKVLSFINKKILSN